jgi:flagellar biosynthetic protein FlhB
MAEDMGDKTEQPTERKLSKARDDGNVAKSPELVSAVDLTAAILLLWFVGAISIELFGGLMRDGLTLANVKETIDPSSALPALGRACIRALPVLAAALAAIVLVSLIAHLQQVKFLFSTKPLEPKPERLNPVEGFKRIFGLKNFVKNGLAVVKLLAILTVIGAAVIFYSRELAMLPMLEVVPAFSAMAVIIFKVTAWVLAILLIIGIVDYAYQLWQHKRDLRMTKNEVKDERKETDGDPEIKARIQRIGREIAMGRMRRDVPKADVIVTNPTHFAVALKYDADKMAAPVVVAKGADFMAFRIREIAMANRVPIVEKPELARGLYANVKVGQAIDSRFYQAVAELLAYVYRLQGKAA